MPDSIQIRDLIEMLERIEDKSARVRLRVPIGTQLAPVFHHTDILKIEKMGANQYVIVST